MFKKQIADLLAHNDKDVESKDLAAKKDSKASKGYAQNSTFKKYPPLQVETAKGVELDADVRTLRSKL